MLRGLGWDVGLPVVGYYALHLAGVHDFVALLVASARQAGDGSRADGGLGCATLARAR